MKDVRSAIFPGVFTGCVLIVWLGLLAYSSPVNAGALEPILLAVSDGQPAASSPANTPTSTAAPAPTDQSSGGLPDSCEVSRSFPDTVLQWCSLITQQARANGLEPNLIAAVMLQESGGNPQAYSRSGAVGLLQVMPRDGIAASFTCGDHPCFASRPTIGELQDPEFNVTYGVKMLVGLLKHYGTMRDALKAYGPANVGYYYADIVLAIYANYQ